MDIEPPIAKTPRRQRTPRTGHRNRTPSKPSFTLVTSDIPSPLSPSPSARSRRRGGTCSLRHRDSVPGVELEVVDGCTATAAGGDATPSATPQRANHSGLRPRRDSTSAAASTSSRRSIARRHHDREREREREPVTEDQHGGIARADSPGHASDGSASASALATRDRGVLIKGYGNSDSRARNTTHHRTSQLPPSMASATGKWREEQILVICPGSRTTMAQLGCSELTPPAHRLPTRMFRDGGEWRPYYTFRRTKTVDGAEQEEWVEDVDEDKGAVWPIEGGRIVHMDAFLAFLDHVHGTLTTTYHNTPIMLMASPQWTRPDCETVARYVFEKTKTPALCMIHSGLATQYGLKWPNMTVVDIGYEKVDVTAIHDGRVVNHMDLGAAQQQPHRRISGGEVFTQRLLALLKDKGFTRDMAEQLKRSNICEVLPYAAAEEGLAELPAETAGGAAASSHSNSAAAAGESAGAPESNNEHPRPAERAADEADGQDHNMDDDNNNNNNGNDDGVLDVASIVTSGQTKEFLAKREKEREREREKGKPGRKPKDAEPPRPVRLPNSKKIRNTFVYEEVVQEEVPREKRAENGAAAAAATAPDTAPVAPEANTAGENPAGGGEAGNGNGSTTAEIPAEAAAAAAAAAPEAKPVEPAEPQTAAAAAAAPPAPVETAEPAPEFRPKRVRRDVEVGLERFLFADRDEIDRIVRLIYRTIQGIDDMYMRPACWDNLVFVGNGARLRGLKENILQTLHARHLVSPSTATMFTSELPSNVATPAGTGSQTPTGSFTGAPHQLPPSGVNPLLQAATTASTLGAQATGGAQGQGVGASETAGPTSGGGGGGGASHHFHSQTPTSIKTATLPGYLSEWTKNGFEEGMFLGAQVAARIAFCLHTNIDAQGVEAQRMMSLSRVDYNELGPKAIRNHSMLS